MKITVTADHVARGTRTACMHCPVAFAYTELTGHLCWVFDGRLKDLATQQIFRLPGTVVGHIVYYDLTGEMDPFSFELAA